MIAPLCRTQVVNWQSSGRGVSINSTAGLPVTRCFESVNIAGVWRNCSLLTSRLHRNSSPRLLISEIRTNACADYPVGVHCSARGERHNLDVRLLCDDNITQVW